jgi:hypothetical protein
MGATMYRCVVGRVPADARLRQRAVEEGLGDPLLAATRLVRGRYTRELLDLVEWMIAIRPEDRPQTVDEVLARLGVGHGEPGTAGSRPGELSVHHRLLFVGPRGAGKRTAIGSLGEGVVAARHARVAFGTRAPEDESVGYARLSLSTNGYLHLYSVNLPEQAKTCQAALDRGVLGFVVLIDNRAEDPLVDLDACLRFLEDLPAGARAAVGVTHTDLIPGRTVAALHARLASRSPHARRHPLPVFEVDARSRREVGLLVQALLYSVDPGA